MPENIYKNHHTLSNEEREPQIQKGRNCTEHLGNHSLRQKLIIIVKKKKSPSKILEVLKHTLKELGSNYTPELKPQSVCEIRTTNSFPKYRWEVFSVLQGTS